jgi:glutamate carboxypeptidase
MQLASVADAELGRLRAHVAAALPEFLADLATLVGIDCGSYTKSGVDQVGRWTAAALGRLGAAVDVAPNRELGDTVVGTLRGVGTAGVLMIGHLDTVFEPGTAAARPFRLEGGRAYGPGVCDMKAGLLAGLYALRALQALGLGSAGPGSAGAGPARGEQADPAAGQARRRPGDAAAGRGVLSWLPLARLTFVANPDEEIGSPVSTALIRELATEHDVALVLECARANGDIVSARKGNLSLVLTLHGRAAHAGVEPERGRSAILEAAYKTIALHELNGRWPGVTCNVGVVRGGTRPNVVAEEAVLEVDLRSPTRAALEAAEAAVREIATRSTVPQVGCVVEVAGRHWPMERLPGTAALVEETVRLAAALGFELRDAATGGASDANTTAGAGVPTLDGLGPVGGLDHSPAEYVVVDSIVERVALLAALLLAIGRGAVTLPTAAMRATAS